MNICIISKNAFLVVSPSNQNFSGGAEFQLNSLAENFNKLGHQVSIITDDFGQKSIEIINEIKYIKVPFRYMGKGKFWIIPDWFLLLRKLIELRADLYLLKGPRFQLAIVGILSKIFKKKVVFISTIDTDSNKILLKELDPVFHRILYNIGLRLIPQVFCQTESQKHNFKYYFNKNSLLVKNIYNINNGFLLSEKKNHVLWVGTNNNAKRPWLMLEFAKRVPDINCKMAMIPASDSKIQRQFENEVGLVPNIEFLGFVPEADMSNIYAEASLLLTFSRLEGFPNVFLHSWAHRTPVISLEIDPDNIIQENNLGFRAGDIDNMVQLVGSLLQDKQKLKKLGENCYDYVRREHHPEKIIEKYIRIIEERN